MNALIKMFLEKEDMNALVADNLVYLFIRILDKLSEKQKTSILSSYSQEYLDAYHQLVNEAPIISNSLNKDENIFYVLDRIDL